MTTRIAIAGAHSGRHRRKLSTPSPPTATLDRVRTWLFSSDQPPSAPPDPALLFSAPGESFECVEIARRIRALAEQGTPFDRIAILLRNVDPYQPLVEEALRRAGIAHYFSRGAARPDPAGRAFLALLACASEGCSASRFAEYLSLGQIPPLDPDGAPQARPPQWIPPDDEILASFQPPPQPRPICQRRRRPFAGCAPSAGRSCWWTPPSSVAATAGRAACVVCAPSSRPSCAIWNEKTRPIARTSSAASSS